MKLYRVSFAADAGEVGTWAGTQADASKARTDFMQKYGLKRKEIHIEDVEVPTRKEDLLAWLNERKV